MENLPEKNLPQEIKDQLSIEALIHVLDLYGSVGVQIESLTTTTEIFDALVRFGLPVYSFKDCRQVLFSNVWIIRDNHKYRKWVENRYNKWKKYGE